MLDGLLGPRYNVRLPNLKMMRLGTKNKYL